MVELQLLLPALGASGQGHLQGGWALVLAIVVLCLVAPVAYFASRNGGQPDNGGPQRHH